MSFSFYSEAEKELNEAIDYYNERQSGLGVDFVEEVYAAIENIISFPYAWAALSKNTRRCLVNRFPYGIIYQIKQDEILIIAVMQLNREPGYWIKRGEAGDFQSNKL